VSTQYKSLYRQKQPDIGPGIKSGRTVAERYSAAAPSLCRITRCVPGRSYPGL